MSLLQTRTASPTGVIIARSLETAEQLAEPTSAIVRQILEIVRQDRTGGTGWLRVTTASDAGVAELTVTNSGSEIPGATIDRLFAPFQRGASDRHGYGLGLAIVRSVTEAHGGTIAARPGDEGGLAIAIRLPKAN